MDKNELKQVLIEVEKEKRNIDHQSQSTDKPIDWQGIVMKLWSGKKFIITVTGVFVALGLVAALTMTKVYTSTVTLVPELGKMNPSSSLGSITSMLGLGGAISGTSSDAYNVTVYPEVVASTPFMTKLFDIHVSDPEEGIDTTLIGYLTRDRFSLTGMILKPILSIFSTDSVETPQKVDVFRLTRKQAAVVETLNKAIVAEVDKKSGETTISVTMDNPVVAATVADTVCKFLREFITEYRTQKARENLESYTKIAEESHQRYLKASRAYAYYQDNNRGLILNAVISEGNRLSTELNIASQIYSQMKVQAEMARGKVIEEKPVFAVIQPASVPLRPQNSRAKVLIIWTFLGFALSTAWVLYGKEYWEKAKTIFKEIKNQ